ncbi:MAG: hypothetical protein PXX77_10865 [Gallionella sp.]|nr:hypothetical protein [Gallionella sp.]
MNRKELIGAPSTKTGSSKADANRPITSLIDVIPRVRSRTTSTVPSLIFYRGPQEVYNQQFGTAIPQPSFHDQTW